jgi:chemosensory pili system protein ChpA (sensor histidine kinase/response regulator)
MDVLKSEVTSLGGRIEVLSAPDQGTTFRLYLPLTLAVTKALLVRSGNREYAIPAAMIEQVLDLKEKGLTRIREARAASWTGNQYPFSYLPHLLGETRALPEKHQQYWVLLLRSGTQRVALQVDELLGNQEIVVKNIGQQLARVIGIDGATVLGNGQVVLILNPVALTGRDHGGTAIAPVPTERKSATSERGMATVPTVMVVDDSLTVRKITSRLLAREGYAVLTAKDGVDALEQMFSTHPDVLLLDIEMPRMDGFELTRNLRAEPRLRDIPIIMITSRTATKHREYARELGVNNYLGKPYQEDELLGLIAGHLAQRAASRLTTA